ncbi:MAG TPA: hypothetical protein VF997_09005 [Polyangia bacterium]
MTKLLGAVALLLAVGCGAPPSTGTATGESEEAFSANGQCYTQYSACAESCDPSDALCLCFCHNALANCTTPKGRLYKCPPDTVDNN